MKTKDIKVESVRKFLNFKEAVVEANRCLLCQDASCSRDCPAGNDPAKFIRQIKFENYKGAARTIRNNNTFGSVCSYVCPADQLCEKNCCLQEFGDPINIRGLQLFAYLYGKKNNLESLDCLYTDTTSKVAIIGAAPAGLSCAAELAKAGFKPVVFEREESIGGVVHANIPQHRLADEALEYDLSNISNLGIEINYNAKISSKNDMLALLDKGFHAIFIATGLTDPLKLSFLDGYTNVIDYVKFLSALKFKTEDFSLAGKIIVVIGGGGTAMDVACSAAINGAKRVYMVALEGLNELPANSEEIELAQKKNVVIKPNSQLTRVKAQDGIVDSVVGVEVEWKTPGDFNPANIKIIDGTEFNLKVDYIIPAIGAKPSIVLSKASSDLENQNAETIIFNDDFSTNIPGVFVGGDIVSGGASITNAVGDGKKAASSIVEFIRRI